MNNYIQPGLINTEYKIKYAIRFNRSYFLSLNGLTRLGIIASASLFSIFTI
jgi:hypothetical protein